MTPNQRLLQRSALVLAAVSLFICPSASPQAKSGSDLKVKVCFLETANLTYQLDAVSGALSHLDPTDFQALWNQEFLKSDQDRDYVKKWRELKERYSGSAAVPAPLMPFESAMSNISLFDRIRVAGLRASSEKEFLDNASWLMMPSDVANMRELLRYFAPRFHTWWQKEASGKGRGFVQRMEKLLTSGQVSHNIASFRRFYAPPLPADSIAYFSFIYRPQRAKAPTGGQQLENVGVVEFLGDEKPEQRVDVVVHEFCHYLYDSRSDTQNLMLQKRFAESKELASKPSFNLLNESMATALGNGVVGRQFHTAEAWKILLAKPSSLYNNPNIDRGGKKLLQLMDQWLPSGKTMDDPSFVNTYIQAQKEAFGDSLTKPSLFLGAAFIHVNDRLGMQFARTLRKRLGVASAYMTVDSNVTEEGLADYRSQLGLSAIFVVSNEQIPSLVGLKLISQEDGDAILKQYSSDKSSLFASARSSYSYNFVIVANGPEEATRRLNQLAEAPKLFNGIHP